MDISKRLLTAARLINGGSLADIGTDHGYLPIHLLKEGRIKRVIAVDINTKPLESCKRNAVKAGLFSQIETRLGSGLSVVNPNEADFISICGLGGILMAEILLNGIDILNNDNPIQPKLILQPQTHWVDVRKAVHAIGYRILSEEIVFEDGMYYSVMFAVPGEEACTEAEYLLGKRNLETRSPIFYEYVKYEKEKTRKALRMASKGKSAEASARSMELSAYLDLLEECYDNLP